MRLGGLAVVALVLGLASAAQAPARGVGAGWSVLHLPLRHQVKVARSQGVFPVPGSRSYAVGREPRGLAAADLDLDGDSDLVVAHRLGHSLAVLRNPAR